MRKGQLLLHENTRKPDRKSSAQCKTLYLYVENILKDHLVAIGGNKYLSVRTTSKFLDWFVIASHFTRRPRVRGAIQVERHKDSLLGLRIGAQSARSRLPPTVLFQLHPALGRGKD